MGRQRNATSAYRIKAKERQAEALELRKAGLTYPEIAKRLGYNRQQVHTSAPKNRKLIYPQTKQSRVFFMPSHSYQRMGGNLWPA